MAEALVNYFEPIRLKIEEYLKDKEYLSNVLSIGNEKARSVAIETLKEVKEKVGLGT